MTVQEALARRADRYEEMAQEAETKRERRELKRRARLLRSIAKRAARREEAAK